jgi:DNA-binding Lrp family transcriptional regulator
MLISEKFSSMRKIYKKCIGDAMKLDDRDIALLSELQRDCRQGLRRISRKLGMSITTVHERIKKLEKEGIIKGYKAILDATKVGNPVIAFIFIRMQYYYPNSSEPLSQRDVAQKISMIPGVSEVHIIGGEWDILVKARARDLKEMGNFIIDRLRKIKGIERTLTTHAWVTLKESPEINLKTFSVISKI